jgi:small-conductance mechanosensitive channel
MDIFNAFVHPIIKLGPKLPEAALNLVVGFILIEVILFFAKRFLKIVRIPKDLKGLFLSGMRAILWLFLIIFVIKALGLGNLVLAISGSAVILAFVLNQGAAGLISDIISGISLAGDKNFHVGMKVSLNEGKTVGIIKSVDMRKVRILDEKGQIHVVPNSVVEKNEWLVLETQTKK